MQDAPRETPSRVTVGPAAPCLVLMLASACNAPAPQAAERADACTADGELVAEIHGSIEASLDWRDEGIECTGMPRPRGEGARLRFAGTVTVNGTPRELAFIIALPELEEGRVAEELSAGVTIIEETSGRFFSTPERAACWADVQRQEPAGKAETPGDNREYRVQGLVYCVSPLPEVHGTGSVTFTDLHFTGRLDWQRPE